MPIEPFSTSSVEGMDDYYRENGFILLRGLFDQETIDRAVKRVWEKIPERLDDRVTWRNKGTRSEMGFADTVEEWSLLGDPGLIDTISVFHGWDRPHWGSTTGSLLLSWRTDSDWVGLHLDFYGSGSKVLLGEELIFGMIFLTDVGEKSARTKVCPGSHQIVHHHLVENPEDPRNLVLYDDIEFFGFKDPVPVHAKAGDVMLFDRLLAHSGGGHREDNPRMMFRFSLHNGVGELATDTVRLPASVVRTMTHEQRALAGFD